MLDRSVQLYFLNTGVPHAIQFVDDVLHVDVKKAGACIRYHDAFKPKGTNANFVQLCGDNTIKIRTYERGVEDETLVAQAPAPRRRRSRRHSRTATHRP